MSEEAGEGFHTKGYMFKNNDIYKIIIGSSNMTQKALSVNREWNTKIVSTEQGEYAKEILNEFERLWNSKYSLNYEKFKNKERLQVQKRFLLWKNTNYNLTQCKFHL